VLKDRLVFREDKQQCTFAHDEIENVVLPEVEFIVCFVMFWSN